MKKAIYLIFVSAFIVAATCNNSEKANSAEATASELTNNKKSQTSKHKRYNVKSGKIVYKISGDVMNGEKTMWWDDYGLKQAEYENSSMGIAGYTQSTKKQTITLIDDEFKSEIYVIDPDKGTGTHMTNDFLSGEGMEEAAWQNLGEKMLKDMGGVKVGNEKIAGVTADKWEIKSAHTFTWIWEFINVKNEVTMGMKIVEEAVSIDTDITVSPDHFDFSKYEIKEMGNASEIMKNLGKY